MTDTSKEAVERLAKRLERVGWNPASYGDEGAAMLRALAAERDAAVARALLDTPAPEPNPDKPQFLNLADFSSSPYPPSPPGNACECHVATPAPATPSPDKGKMVRPKPGARCGGYPPPSGRAYTPGPRQAVAEYPAQPSPDAQAAANADHAARVLASIHADKLRALVDALQTISDKISWEINPSNYTHQEVCDINSDWCEIGNIADAALAGITAPRQE